jgi:AraC-like DNA-binding protein
MGSKKNIQAAFYKSAPLGNDSLELVGWSGNHWDNISFFPKNYQVGYVKEGKGQFFVGDNVLPISEGQFFLIHPGKIHSGKPDENAGWAVDTIVIKKELAEELFSPSVSIVFPDFVVDDEGLKTLFMQTLDLLNSFESTLENEGKLYLLLTDLLKLRATVLQNGEVKENQNEAVDRAVNFITKNFKSGFSLDELAEQAFLSKFHLLRVFKAKTGLTPYTYQVQLRLNEARRLIFQDKPLTEIAYELGFADQAHFTNTFKKYANGANPSDLLKTAISYNFRE